jgi:hypothetical protein
VNHSLDIHHDKGLNDLLEDPQNLLHGKLLVLLLKVVEQIAVLAVLHNDF